MSDNGRIRLRVDPANPGEFFACCGLLELSYRLWRDVRGWFSAPADEFFIDVQTPGDVSVSQTLLATIAACPLGNTMSPEQRRRRAELSRSRETKEKVDLGNEKKALDALWREAPVLMGSPIALRLDWFADRWGGSLFKTWAGQQSATDIAVGMRDAFTKTVIDRQTSEWFALAPPTDALPFNFDSNLGGVGSDRDVGFSFDPLQSIRIRSRPLVELGAFVGLQRFRPARVNRDNLFRYVAWTQPLVPAVAAAAVAGALGVRNLRQFEYRLLYRTKYLKSFLPATPV